MSRLDLEEAHQRIMGKILSHFPIPLPDIHYFKYRCGDESYFIFYASPLSPILTINILKLLYVTEVNPLACKKLYSIFLKNSSVHVRHITKNGQSLYLNIKFHFLQL